MNTFTLGACFQHEFHTGPYFMTFAPRLKLIGQTEQSGNGSSASDFKGVHFYSHHFRRKKNF